MWSLDGTTVQITIKTMSLQGYVSLRRLGDMGFLSLFELLVFDGFLWFEGFFPIFNILLWFVPYRYMCPRLSLHDSCSSLSTCEISKSTCCSCSSGDPSSELPQASLRSLHFSHSAAYTTCLIPFFPHSFWE